MKVILQAQEVRSLDSIEYICQVLNCGVDDILGFIDEEDKA